MNYLGDRIKKIRVEEFNLNQIEFANQINTFIDENEKFKNETEAQKNKLKFNQTILSNLENNSNIVIKRFLVLIQFLHNQKRINPNWVIIENNLYQPLLISKLEIDKSLIDIKNEIVKNINDIEIIIHNSSINNK